METQGRMHLNNQMHPEVIQDHLVLPDLQDCKVVLDQMGHLVMLVLRDPLVLLVSRAQLETLVLLVLLVLLVFRAQLDLRAYKAPRDRQVIWDR